MPADAPWCVVDLLRVEIHLVARGVDLAPRRVARRDRARHAHARVDDWLELHVIAGVLEQGVERAVAIDLIGGLFPRVADGDDPDDGGVAGASREGAEQTRGCFGARNASKFTPG